MYLHPFFSAISFVDHIINRRLIDLSLHLAFEQRTGDGP